MAFVFGSLCALGHEEEKISLFHLPSGDPALVIERALEDLLKKTLKTKTAQRPT
jgi:hypothetical protein